MEAAAKQRVAFEGLATKATVKLVVLGYLTLDTQSWLRGNLFCLWKPPAETSQWELARREYH